MRRRKLAVRVWNRDTQTSRRAGEISLIHLYFPIHLKPGSGETGVFNPEDAGKMKTSSSKE